MPLPLAPIALGLAAAGLKMYGGHTALLEFVQHPLDLLAGHSGASSLEELGEHLRKWVAGNQPPENEDLERVIIRSALLADLFCLSEGLPRELGAGDRLGRLREQLGSLLGSPRQGLFSQADEMRIRAAVEGTRQCLHALEAGTLRPVEIDPTRLLRVSPKDDYAVGLATAALETVERAYQAMPETVRTIFKDRWFGYLCLVFREEIKTNDRVYRIFTLMQTATGFLDLERVIRAESDLTRGEGRQQHGETSRRLDELRALIEPPLTAEFAYGLPARGSVVGRDAEIDTGFREWMTDRSRPLLIWGPPGIGKSTLALALLHHPGAEQKFGARRFMIRCDGFANVIALQLGMGSEWFGLTASPRIGGEVLAKLREGPAAIVVDNFETPYRAAGDESEDWLRKLVGVPNVWLIVGVQGHEAPGGIDWIRRLEPTRLTLEQSRQLFCRIAGVEVERSPVLDELLLGLDGVPHAIELLARQAESDLDVSSLADRWNRQRTTLLQRGVGTTRQTNIAIAYEFAIASPLMSGAPMRMLRILAALPGGLATHDVPMAMEVLNGVTAQDAAATLKRCALAFAEGDRLRMLAPLREHVLRAHPVVPGELHHVQTRFLQMAHSGHQVGDVGGGHVLRILTRDHLNCRWAVEAALDRADPTAVRAAMGFGNFSKFSGVDGTDLLERAREFAHQASDRRGEARCSLALGDFALQRSLYSSARQRYEEARLIYRELGDRAGEADCIKRLGDIAFERIDYTNAQLLYEEALAIYKAVRDRRGEAVSFLHLGNIALRRRDHVGAGKRYEEALPIYREVGDRRGETWCMLLLGTVALARGDHADARKRYESVLPIYQEFGDRRGEAVCLERLGDAALERCDYAFARRLCLQRLGDTELRRSDYASGWQRYEEARVIHREIADRREEAWCMLVQGNIAVARGDHADAQQRFEGVLRIFREVGDRRGEAVCCQRLGDTALERNEDADALQSYEQALPIYREVGDRQGEANCVYGLGDTALRRSDHAAAGQRYEEAQSIYRETGDRHGDANCIVRMGDVALARGDPEGARQRYQEVLERFRSLPESYSIGRSVRHLARLEHEPEKRIALIREVVDWWTKIDRQDLVEELAGEFPEADMLNG